MGFQLIRLLQISADGAIFVCYMGLAVWCWSFLRDIPKKPAVALGIVFGGFIFFCGLTHLLDMVAEIRNECGVGWGSLGIVKVLTAGVSVAALVTAWGLFLPAKNILRAARPVLIDPAWARQRFEKIDQIRENLHQTEAELRAKIP